MLDTPIKSAATSVSLLLAGWLVGWLSSHNFLPPNQVPEGTAVVSSIILGAGGMALTWWKARSHTPSAKVLATGELPSVEAVVVKPGEVGEVGNLARDPAAPNVVLKGSASAVAKAA